MSVVKFVCDVIEESTSGIIRHTNQGFLELGISSKKELVFDSHTGQSLKSKRLHRLNKQSEDFKSDMIDEVFRK